MTILKGIIQNGQVVLPQPTDLPEGTEVQVVPIDLGVSADDERPVTSDEIARTLAAMERVQPFEMTDTGAGRDRGRSPCPQGMREIAILERPSPSQCGGVRASYGLRVPSPMTRTGAASGRRFAETSMG